MEEERVREREKVYNSWVVVEVVIRAIISIIINKRIVELWVYFITVVVSYLVLGCFVYSNK